MECDLKAREVLPFKPTHAVMNNIVLDYISLGRYDEARKLLPMIPNALTRERREVDLALAVADWATVDRILATGLLKEKSPQVVDAVLASLDAARGAVRRAATRHQSSLKETRIDDEYAFGRCFRMVHIVEIAGIRDVLANVSACTDTTVPGLVVDGFRAVFAGDMSAALRSLGATRRKPVYLQRKYSTDIAVLEARIAAARGEWDKITGLLEPLSQDGRVPAFCGRLPIRWLVADAYENMGQKERAAESYERVLSPIKLTPLGEMYAFPSYSSFAHYRLVLLYAQLGRAEEARKHYDAFRAVFTEPDPELASMLEEARLAVTRFEKR
jgi:tetratricopeptide (TPR) repeat protein